MKTTGPIPTHSPETHRSPDQLGREFRMIEPSTVIAFTPTPMEPGLCDTYDIGTPLAEINAGKSRFVVYEEHERGLVLAYATPGAARPLDGEQAPRYRVDRTYNWPLSEQAVDVGREDKPGQPDGTMSAWHFRAGMHGSKLFVGDFGSLNGTSVRARPALGDKGFTTMMGETQSAETVAEEFGERLRAGCSAFTQELLQAHSDTLLPTKRVTIGEKNFYLTDIIGQIGQRPHAVMYTDAVIDGVPVQVPRLLYMSNSDGGWRVAYGVSDGGRFVKETRDNSHYTQETKLMRHLVDALEEQAAQPDTDGSIANDLRRLFALHRPSTRQAHTGKDEITYYHSAHADELLDPARKISAGHMGSHGRGMLHAEGHTTISSYLQSLDAPLYDAMPEFRDTPRASYRTKHSLLGSITIDEFDTTLDDRPVTWSMGRDDEGRVWVDNVYFTDSAVSSYGTRAEVLDMGCVTSKPYEYTHQASLLTGGEWEQPGDMRYANTYVDITPVLSRLLPVTVYMAAQHIERTVPTRDTVDTL